MIFAYVKKGTRFFVYIPKTNDGKPKLLECSVIGNYFYLYDNSVYRITQVLTSEGEMAIRGERLYENLYAAMHQSGYWKDIVVYDSLQKFYQSKSTQLCNLTETADTDTDNISFDFRGYIHNEKLLYGGGHKSTAARLEYYYIKDGHVFLGYTDAEFLSYDEDTKLFTPMEYSGIVVPCASEKGYYNDQKVALAELFKNVTVVTLNQDCQVVEEKMKAENNLRKKLAAWAQKQQVSLDELKALLDTKDIND